jgi:3-carboxy-cis,cis-muconate cycloisomerase
MLHVQAALARSCADIGVETASNADEIAAACATVQLDADQVLAHGWQMGTPVLALRAALAEHLSPPAAAALKGGHGSTSQDIIDTALQLQIRAGLRALAADLRPLAQRLVQLATTHRSTPMIGRTFMQHARATTFGLRVAQWLDPVAELLAQIDASQSACCIQLGGPVGTLDDFSGRGQDVSARFADRLDLQQPITSWHGDRRRITEVCDLVGRLSGCMAKIATDIALLSSTEINEIHVRSGGSSSMAGKRNPFDSVRTLAAAHSCLGAVNTVSTAAPIELERGLGGWHVEWFAVPMVFMTGAAAVEATLASLHSLQVDDAAMLRSLGDQASVETTALAAAAADRILAHHAPTIPG